MRPRSRRRNIAPASQRGSWPNMRINCTARSGIRANSVSPASTGDCGSGGRMSAAKRSGPRNWGRETLRRLGPCGRKTEVEVCYDIGSLVTEDGRVKCRERGWQYGESSVGAGILKKKKKK